MENTDVERPPLANRVKGDYFEFGCHRCRTFPGGIVTIFFERRRYRELGLH
jgi:hypothetical protein